MLSIQWTTKGWHDPTRWPSPSSWKHTTEIRFQWDENEKKKKTKKNKLQNYNSNSKKKRDKTKLEKHRSLLFFSFMYTDVKTFASRKKLLRPVSAIRFFFLSMFVHPRSLSHSSRPYKFTLSHSHSFDLSLSLSLSFFTKRATSDKYKRQKK